MKFRSINTCTVIPLPFLCPDSSFLNLSSTPLLIVSIIILHSISLTTESKVMPLQFVQCLVFPFFATCSLMISPHLKLFQIFSYSNILMIPSVDVFSLLKTLCHSAFCNSAVMESIPSAFPFCSLFIAALTLPSVGSFTAISSTVSQMSSS